ncbi:MAG: hypothetical protein ASUL_00590 [Candidatus Aramenus sulfurataquae]|jgi:hypothetical protein|uniref:Uncharacterized protein n=3 Tax=Candidatus Aramenus sulfurataquae TaxID=1326980 RepID=W7KXQ9_9CREN|nr:MAG: hypothetical protein ASUL_00590 [Candidatus Aramenus sulfurataquae]MCL7343051.1 hypothetical protein [Candidatus Aramenus sulfurataquae]
MKKILVHIYKYGPDNPWYMARRLLGESGWAPKYNEDEIDLACRELEKMGYLTRFQGALKKSVTSSVKPWLKVKAKEMGHKPKGIYFDLTKEGRRAASQLYKEFRENETSKGVKGK